MTTAPTANEAIALRRPIVNRVRPGYPTVLGLHHWAYRCRNSEETRHFYEDILGLPLAFVVFHERVPSTGEHAPYFHIFFELHDGSHIAFFDLLDGKPYQQDPQTPSWLHHIALAVDSRQALIDAKARLEAHGIEVLGIVDHSGLFDSIYFFDPNGMRLELAFQRAPRERWESMAREAHARLATRDAIAAEFAARRAQKTE